MSFNPASKLQTESKSGSIGTLFIIPTKSVNFAQPTRGTNESFKQAEKDYYYTSIFLSVNRFKWILWIPLLIPSEVSPRIACASSNVATSPIARSFPRLRCARQLDLLSWDSWVSLSSSSSSPSITSSSDPPDNFLGIFFSIFVLLKAYPFVSLFDYWISWSFRNWTTRCWKLVYKISQDASMLPRVC